MLATLIAAAAGLWSLARLPIDAVPDITNNQVQINSVAPALSPTDIERQVTFPVETALAGIPGLEYTRSLSRNGFSQVTAVFTDRTDIYFARQQVGERLIEARRWLPPGVEPRMGPISTGLGEIYMWTVGFAPSGGESADARRPAGTGNRTAPTSRPRGNACAAISNVPPTCAPCRTGSSGRSCATCPASPASTRSADT